MGFVRRAANRWVDAEDARCGEWLVRGRLLKAVPTQLVWSEVVEQ